MSLSIRRSIIEQFNFEGKNVRSFYVKGIGGCLVACDVWRAVGYSDDDNGRKAIQSHVPEKYRMRYKDVKTELNYPVPIHRLKKDQVLLTEAGLNCFLLRCKMEKADPFMEWVCEEVIPREIRKLAAEIEEKDTQLALLNDDLMESQDHVRQLQLNNTGLQGEITAMGREIERRQTEIAELRQRYVDHCRDPGKDNVIMIFRKHTCKDDDKHFEYPYYISRIQRRKVTTKRQKLQEKFPHGEEIVVIDNPNSVHAFNRFEEEEHVERYGCHFKLIDLTREDLYDIGVPAIAE